MATLTIRDKAIGRGHLVTQKRKVAKPELGKEREFFLAKAKKSHEQAERQLNESAKVGDQTITGGLREYIREDDEQSLKLAVKRHKYLAECKDAGTEVDPVMVKDLTRIVSADDCRLIAKVKDRIAQHESTLSVGIPDLASIEMQNWFLTGTAMVEVSAPAIKQDADHRLNFRLQGNVCKIMTKHGISLTDINPDLVEGRPTYGPENDDLLDYIEWDESKPFLVEPK